MSRVRESVEWGFSLILRDWSFLDFRKNLKIGKQPIGLLYFVGALMANVKTCMMAEMHDCFGNEIAVKFRVHPPSVHEYLHS